MTFENEVGQKGIEFQKNRDSSLLETKEYSARNNWLLERWRKIWYGSDYYNPNINPHAPRNLATSSDNSPKLDPLDRETMSDINPYGSAGRRSGIDVDDDLVDRDPNTTDFQELEGNFELGGNDSGVGGFGGTFEGSAGDDRDGD